LKKSKMSKGRRSKTPRAEGGERGPFHGKAGSGGAGVEHKKKRENLRNGNFGLKERKKVQMQTSGGETQVFLKGETGQGHRRS